MVEITNFTFLLLRIQSEVIFLHQFRFSDLLGEESLNETDLIVEESDIIVRSIVLQRTDLMKEGLKFEVNVFGGHSGYRLRKIFFVASLF